MDCTNFSSDPKLLVATADAADAKLLVANIFVVADLGRATGSACGPMATWRSGSLALDEEATLHSFLKKSKRCF